MSSFFHAFEFRPDILHLPICEVLLIKRGGAGIEHARLSNIIESDGSVLTGRIPTNMIRPKCLLRRGRESNPRIEVLQTPTLPLGYPALEPRTESMSGASRCQRGEPSRERSSGTKACQLHLFKRGIYFAPLRVESGFLLSHMVLPISRRLCAPCANRSPRFHRPLER